MPSETRQTVVENSVGNGPFVVLVSHPESPVKGIVFKGRKNLFVTVVPVLGKPALEDGETVKCTRFTRGEAEDVVRILRSSRPEALMSVEHVDWL